MPRKVTLNDHINAAKIGELLMSGISSLIIPLRILDSIYKIVACMFMNE